MPFNDFNELIDPVTNCWKTELLQAVFSDEEVMSIRSIPLSVRSPPDHSMWHYERHGKFTVRSAYHTARNWTQPTNNGASSSTHATAGNNFWTKLWGANIPPKVKVCAWRLCNDFVPTRANLARRHIPTDYTCVMCNTVGETTIHLMKDCPYAKCAWLASNLGVLLRNVHPPSFILWIGEIVEKIPKSSFDSFLMICWALWGSRNEKLWKEKHDPPDLCVTKVIQWWQEFVDTNVSTSNRNPCIPINPKWSPPSAGCLKMNIDGFWSGERKVAGFGLVIRGDIGNFVAAKCGSFMNVFTPLLAEATAIREGLCWAVDRGFQNMSFESDSLQIVEASKDLSLKLSPIGQIVEDIKALLRSITEAIFTHTRRQANFVAHRLARVGPSVIQTCEWNGTPPFIIADLLLEDSVMPMN